MASEKAILQNPLDKYPKPPYSNEPVSAPGTEGELNPKADHGENSYKGSGKLAGRRAVITGGDSGIGRAVAIAFAREGADVLISYLNEHEDAKDTARIIEEAGRKAVLVPGDIQEEQHCISIIEKAETENMRMSLLIGI